MNSRIIRIGGGAAVLAGILRVLSSVLPTPSARIMTLYLVIDVLLFFGSIGLFEFQRVEAGFMGVLAILLQIPAALVLIARDLGILGAAAYPIGALMYALGLDLFAIASWRSRTLPRWTLVLLILSTLIGPIGFLSQGLAFLFTVSGILFGIGFASAGVAACAPGQQP